MDKIEKICQEIAQLKGVKLYTFSDIPSEEPVADGLEEEVKNYFQGYWPGTETAEQCNTDLHFTPTAILRLARHFAEWQKQQMMKGAWEYEADRHGEPTKITIDKYVQQFKGISPGQKFKVIVIPED